MFFAAFVGSLVTVRVVDSFMVGIKACVHILIALPVVECVNSAMLHVIEDYLLEDLTLRPSLLMYCRSASVANLSLRVFFLL